MSRYKKLQEKEYEEQNKFVSQIMSDPRAKNKQLYLSYDEAREMLENEELRRPNYLYELRYETINKDSFVDFDQDSINNFTFETDTTKLIHTTYACQDFYDKAGRFLCRNSTKLPDVPMVDALFCLLFAPVVQVLADDSKSHFSRIVCDHGEMVIPLTHILTHKDLEYAQRVRNMLNESLCDEDKQKQSHNLQIDYYVKMLLNIKRLSVDVYVKLDALREEDDSNKTGKAFIDRIKKHAQDEDNFFLDDEVHELLENKQSFENVEMNEEGDILMDRAKQYEADCEKGYFLQRIYVQKINKKIYFTADNVKDMLDEFRGRIVKKREIISQMKQKVKELMMRDTMLICDRCKQDIAPLKTLDFVSPDLHHAKCVFGTLRKVEVEEALEHPDYA